MPLVYENGSGAINGNTYVTVQEMRDYFVTKNVVYSGADDALGAILIDAFMFVEAYASQFLGEKTYPETRPEWPRKNTGISWLTEITIPANVKVAQMEAAIYGAVAPLSPVSTGRGNILRQKIGPIETEYADLQTTGGGGVEITIPYVSQLLRKFMRNSSGQARVYRG